MRDSVTNALIAAVFLAGLTLLSLRSGPVRDEPGSGDGAWAATAAAVGPEAAAATEGASAAIAAAEQAVAPQAGFDAAFRLPVLRDGETVSMALDAYLTGVILAEMPLSFADEALKAQAVASRTYALRSYAHRRHGSAALCTDAGCCQSWKDPATVSAADRARAEAAVRATDGLALYYDGALIDATFFACSGGQTEAAAAVWGTDLPYLQAVESPGEEGAAHFTDETRVPLAEFRAALEAMDPEVRLSADPGGWLGEVQYTPGGGVAEIELGGRPFTGKALRKRFGLRSTAFTLELSAAEAVFTTRGWGHRVGMSQYGADAMARTGKDFAEILAWYYRGAVLAPAGAGT